MGQQHSRPSGSSYASNKSTTTSNSEDSKNIKNPDGNFSDLERIDSFQGWLPHPTLPHIPHMPQMPHVLTRHHNSQDDSEELSILDEETWDWPVLLTRVFCFFLLLCTIVLLGLGGLDIKYFILSSLTFALLLIILIGTYVDIT
jgi:hypothetical protein